MIKEPIDNDLSTYFKLENIHSANMLTNDDVTMTDEEAFSCLRENLLVTSAAEKLRADRDYFDDTTTAFYTVVNPDVPFLTSLRCLAFPDDRFVCIKDTTLLKEGEEGRVQKSYFRSRDEILSAFQRYFPQFPESMIIAATSDLNMK